VHTGLILAAQSESELAGVMAHEVAHVTQRHIARMVGRQSETGLLMLASLLVAVLAAKSSPQMSQAAIMGGQAAGMSSQLAYSRSFENEADRIGLQNLTAAGFDVRGMSAFFERLQKNSRLYENNAPAYLRTHPSPASGSPRWRAG
jgi:predicted Zn-dependent protease